MRFRPLLYLFLAVVAEVAPAQPTGDLVTVELKDGTVLWGRITAESDTSLTVVTIGGLEIVFPNPLRRYFPARRLIRHS